MMDQTARDMVNEVKLIYRSKVRALQRPHIKESRDCYELLLKY